MWKWAAAAAFAVLLLVGLWAARETWGERASRAPGRAGEPVPPEPPHLGAPEAPAAPKPPASRGVVVDEEDHPISGALVRWRVFGRDQGPDARAGADGTFVFETAGDSDGSYVVEALGFASRTAASGTEKIVLFRGARSVRVRVVDEEERPVEGATVEAFVGDAYGRGVTDALGVVEIPGLFPYSSESGGLLVRANGYVPQAAPCMILDEDGDAETRTVTLSRGGVIRGVVRDAATSRPVGGARVSYSAEPWSEGSTTTDNLGAFQFRCVPLDAGWLYAYADGYLPGREGWSPSPFDRLERRVFPEGERDIVRDLLVVRSVTVHGVVLDRNGDAVAAASVGVREQWPDASPRELVPELLPYTSTDARGAFAVAGYYAGTALTVTATSASGLVEAEARAGDGEILLRLLPTRRVAGRVVDARHAPASRAAARLRRPGEKDWAGCDEDGRFALEHVRLGPWDLLVGAPGLVTLETTIDVADEESDLDLGDIVLGGGCVLAGQVVDPDGLPIEGATVTASSEDERPGGERHGTARTDEEGRFCITGLHDGEFEVEVWDPGWRRARATIRAAQTDLRLVMQAVVTVCGRVLGSGKPVAEADVNTTGGDDAATGPEGEFEITGLAAGQPFGLKISHTLFKTLSLGEVLPWEGVRDFTLVEGRTCEGTVVDEKGQPLGDMYVEVYAAGATKAARAKNYEDRRCVWSDAQGRWRVGGLEEGGTVVELSGVGYVSEDPVEIAAGLASCQLIARKGYQVRGTVRRKDGHAVPEASVTVYRADGSEVPRGFRWDSVYSRFSTSNLPAGRYKLVVRGRSESFAGVAKEEYGETTIEVTVPGPDVEIVLPK